MRSLRVILIAIAIIGVIITCSDKEEPVGPDLQPGMFTISPDSGKPGDLIMVSGLAVIDSSNVQFHSFYIGGELLPLRLINDTIYLAVPLFFDTTTGWCNPPAEPTSIVHKSKEVVTSVSSNGLKILPLPKAPGTTLKIQVMIDSLATNLDIIFDNLPTVYSWEAEFRDSIVGLIRTISSEGENSIASLLDGTSPLLDGFASDPELADALLSSMGAVEYWEAYTGRFALASGKVSEALAAGRAAGFCEDGGPDVELACLMQMYVLLDGWAETVLHETQQDWNNSVGIFFQLVSYHPAASACVPCKVGAMIGPTLQMLDVIVNNAVLSLYPSQISLFTLNIAPDSIDIDQHTNSQIVLMAKNSPETLTMNEIVDAVMAGAGMLLPGPTWADDIKIVLLEVARVWIDKLRGILIYMGGVDPAVFGNLNLTDPEVFTFPTLYFGPVAVTNHDLITYHSYDPEIIAPDTNIMLEWEGVSRGVGQVNVHTRGPGVRTKKIRDLMFCLCSYTGGAFGENAAVTNTVSMIVGRQGQLEVIIDGLPEDLEADVLVTYPDGATFTHLSATETLDTLEPGDYRIQAYDRTDTYGLVYVADPAEQYITVVSGETVTANVDYSSEFGSILFTVSGLPYYVDADLDVAGPDGSSYHLMGDSLLDSLPEGDYTFTGNRVSHSSSNRSWDAHPPTQTITVVGGETATGGVNYKSIYGTIVVTVNKPDRVGGDIDLDGDSLSQHITQTTTIGNVYVGTYSLIANDVLLDSTITLFAEPRSQSIQVTAGDTSFVTVDYTAPITISWTYGPSKRDLGDSYSESHDTLSTIDTATVEENLSPPGFQVNERYRLITTSTANVSSTASTSTARANSEASLSISGSGTSGTINIKAEANTQKGDAGGAVADSEVGFGHSGHFGVDTLVNPNTAIATGLCVKVENPSEQPFYFTIDWDFSASSDIDNIHNATASYYILTTSHQYNNPESQGPFQLNYGVMAESCLQFPPADTTCWRGNRLYSTVRYGKSPAYFEFYIGAYAYARTVSSQSSSDASAVLQGLININIMEGDPEGK